MQSCPHKNTFQKKHPPSQARCTHFFCTNSLMSWIPFSIWREGDGPLCVALRCVALRCAASRARSLLGRICFWFCFSRQDFFAGKKTFLRFRSCCELWWLAWLQQKQVMSLTSVVAGIESVARRAQRRRFAPSLRPFRTSLRDVLNVSNRVSAFQSRSSLDQVLFSLGKLFSHVREDSRRVAFSEFQSSPLPY